MVAHKQSVGSIISKQATTVAIFGGLIAVGLWGQHTHWSFIPAKHAVAASNSEQAASGTSTSLKVDSPMAVDFDSAQAVEESGISTVPITRLDMMEEVVAPATVEYDQRLVARLSTRVKGTIWRADRHWGEPVKAGDVLAVIEAADVGRTKAEFLTALVSTDASEENLEMLLSAGSSIPQRQLREARLELREARIRLLNAEQALVNLGLNIQMEDYQKLPDTQQAAKLHSIGLPSEIADSLDPKTTTSNLLPIMAPFDGIIIQREAGLGEVVEPGRMLFSVADVRKMWIHFEVPKEDVPKLRLGQEVTFHVDGIDHDIRSTIAWISTEVNIETRTLEARVEVENPIAHPDQGSAVHQRLLRANSYGIARVRIRTVAEAMAVPTACIQVDGRDHIVFVKTGEKTFEGRRVQCGITEKGLVEIHGNILPDDMVACRGSHVLKSQVLLTRMEAGGM